MHTHTPTKNVEKLKYNVLSKSNAIAIAIDDRELLHHSVIYIFRTKDFYIYKIEKTIMYIAIEKKIRCSIRCAAHESEEEGDSCTTTHIRHPTFIFHLYHNNERNIALSRTDLR